jgi:hypothetical protein
MPEYQSIPANFRDCAKLVKAGGGHDPFNQSNIIFINFIFLGDS